MSSKLSNAQLELLKVFSRDMSDAELAEFKRYIVSFYATKAKDAADRVWEEEGWDDDYVQKLLRTKMRKRN